MSIVGPAFGLSAVCPKRFIILPRGSARLNCCAPPKIWTGRFSLLTLHIDRIRGVRGSTPQRTSGQHPPATLSGSPLLSPLTVVLDRLHCVFRIPSDSISLSKFKVGQYKVSCGGRFASRRGRVEPGT